MPTGESFVRHILSGRLYFHEKFSAMPRVAINFDPFGHSRGLVQILSKTGYDSYICCRPNVNDVDIPDDFLWKGYDDSQVAVHRSRGNYTSETGKAAEKIEDWIGKGGDLVLWGTGNHGGGASRFDLDKIDALISRMETEGIQIVHSTPDQYFERQIGRELSVLAEPLVPSCVGCYTSQIRVKQRHRELESAFYMLEKMLSHASLLGSLRYPKEKMDVILKDLMLAQFHDCLPGSAIQPAEEHILRLLGHGLEEASRLRMKAFTRLAAGQEPAPRGDVTLLAYNPHPYPVEGIFECEFQQDRPNFQKDKVMMPIMHLDGKRLECQTEKELCTIPVDWRKRVSFRAELPPSSMSRIHCAVELRSPLKIELGERDGQIEFKTGELDVCVNTETGLIDRFIVNGRSYLRKGAFRPVVIKDSADAWSSKVTEFKDRVGEFQLMSPEESARFSGVDALCLPAVRVIEDGAVRSIVEAVMRYRDSTLCQWYILPKKGDRIEVQTRVYWNEKQEMLKLELPMAFDTASYYGQSAYGYDELPATCRENVSQKWLAVTDGDMCLTVINNGVYSSSMSENVLYMTLLRSPSYAAHASIFGDEPTILPQDRFTPHCDQGERIYKLQISAGPRNVKFPEAQRQAQVFHEPPFILPFTPSGLGAKPAPMVIFSNPDVEMSAFKLAERGNDYILRVFEPTGRRQHTKIDLPVLGISHEIRLAPFEIATLRLDVDNKRLLSENMLEGLQRN